MRVLLPALLLLGGALAVAGQPADAGRALAGTWTWTYPNVILPVSGGTFNVGQGTETGTLALGGDAGHWTVELPSATVGCVGGKPLYAPKLAQTVLVQTYPDGSCRLYAYNDNHYVPYWTDGTSFAGATAGPFWGIGDFR